MGDGARDDDDTVVAWLLARESGRPGPRVSDATAARYAQLEALLADLLPPDANVPRADWQDRVFAAIHDRVEPGAPRGEPCARRRGRRAPPRRRTRSAYRH
jgi:hypothetical protein